MMDDATSEDEVGELEDEQCRLDDEINETILEDEIDDLVDELEETCLL